MATRYVADKINKIIHDTSLDLSDSVREQCLLDKIGEADREDVFSEEGIIQKISAEDYNGCKWCLSRYHLR